MNPKHIEEAEAQNLELIENATQDNGLKGWYNYKLYRFKDCQHTECYPIEMKETLVNRLLEVKNNEQLNI